MPAPATRSFMHASTESNAAVTPSFHPQAAARRGLLGEQRIAAHKCRSRRKMHILVVIAVMRWPARRGSSHSSFACSCAVILCRRPLEAFELIDHPVE